MDHKELVKQLERWGLAVTYATQRREEVAPNPRQHIIERSRRFAPLTLKKAKKTLVPRDGEDRRRIMAKAACVKGMPVTPMWAVDPIRCTSTRKGQWARPADVHIDMPTELMWINSALAALGRKASILELVVRFEYTFEGTQRERALAAQRAYRGALTYWQYRKELERALALMEGFWMAQERVPEPAMA